MPTAIVIDDKWLTANSLVQILGLFGLKAQIALGARAGVQMLKDKKPDAVFLDVHMPGVDGIEFLKYIRHLPGYEDMPIIVVTSDDQPETEARVRSYGAVDVLIKPVEIDLLEASLIQAKIIKAQEK